MEQFIPQVSVADVDRIIKRDFPSNQHAIILEMIAKAGQGEKPRIVLACLKNARSDIERLKNQLSEASGYYREIIAEAEYPNYLKKWSRADQLSETEQQKIIESDKLQFLEWFGRD